MCRKMIVLFSFVLLLGVVSNAEDIQWVGGGADNLWSTPENWDLGRIPTMDDEVRIDVPAAAAPNGPVIQDGIDAKAKGVFTEAAGEPTLTITGGTLEVAEWIWWGDGNGSYSIWDMSGGTVSVTDEFELGWGGGAGTLTITGGTINAGEAVVPTGSGAFGLLYLNGGTYNVTKPGGLEVNATGMIDITEGTLVLEGDDTVKVNDLIAAGQLTAYGGAGQIEVDFDVSNPGKTTVTAIAATIEKTVLFSEDFEGLTLGPNVDEALAGDAVWTDTPPEGWTVDDSGIPGIGLDATDGVTEWAGWAFVDKAWWIEAAEDQDRSLFELGIGIVAVADPDEWDNAERLPIPISADPYDTWLTTPEIKISGVEAGTLELKFDSSWRPEFDDNYHQSATITVSFDGGEPVPVLLWESDEASANYHPYATNETVIVNLDNPEGARKLVLTFGLFDAGDDWWWAIDNIEVRGVVPYQEPFNPGTNGLLACYPLNGDANDISGNGINGTIFNAETGGLGEGGSVWVDDPERGTVISFNGTASGAYVRAGEIPQMTLTNDFTWAFWAKHSDENTADNDIILGNRMDENAVDFVPRQFIKFTPTKFEWHMNGNGDDNLDYEDIPADIWLHHAVVKTGDQLTYYRNGVESSSGTITQALDFPQPLYFGGDNEGAEGENWSGLMSDVCIYDRALSEAEVRYLTGERAIPVDPGSNGLVAYYALEDDVNDSSGNGLDGVIVGDPNFVEGAVGMGLQLDGVDDYVDLGNDPLFDLTGSEVTLSLWVNTQDIGNTENNPWLGKGDTSYMIKGHRDGNQIEFFIYDGGWITAHADVGADFNGEWHHAAGTFDGDQLKIYVDGEEAVSADYDGVGIVNNDYNVAIGTNTQASGRFSESIIDEAMIYNRALSAGEIRYLAGFRPPIDPIHSYTFEDGTGNDSVGDADGVLVGDAAIVDGSLVIDGDGDWMEMPGDVIAINTYTEMTLELWSTQSVDNPFSMTASFGGTWDNGMGKDYIFIATGRGDQMNRGAIANTPDDVNPWEDEVGVSSPELNDGIEHQYVLTITAEELAYYVDGILIGTAPMGDTTITGVSNDFVYLGKGVYSVDGTMNCSINEFNIYNVALDAEQIAANYVAGPVK